MSNYITPQVIKKFSGIKVQLWNWIEDEVGNRNGPFKINQSKLAKKFNVSRTSIINALKTFVSANLLEKCSSGKGRGNHCRYRLIWTFREKNVTPTRVKGTTPRKKQTKGRSYRYYAFKFRKLVERSSLAEKSQIIVGKILKFLKNKPPDMFKSWLSHLKNWLAGTPKVKTLRDFFVFFHDGLMETARSKREIEYTERRIEKAREEREEVKEGYQNDPPPKSSDFKSFAAYREAMKDWEKERKPTGG